MKELFFLLLCIIKFEFFSINEVNQNPELLAPNENNCASILKLIIKYVLISYPHTAITGSAGTLKLSF
jgi:hypothetical protein